MTANNYHATPYDISATGFYFHNYEDYEAKARNHRNEYGDVVEEFEIQNVSGDNYQLFNALGINQTNLRIWFEDFEDMQGTDVVAAIYLAEYLNVDMSDIMDKLDGVSFYEGRAQTYAQDYLEDSGLLDEVPESLKYYIDVDAFARDMLLAGDITEIDIMGPHTSSGIVEPSDRYQPKTPSCNQTTPPFYDSSQEPPDSFRAREKF